MARVAFLLLGGLLLALPGASALVSPVEIAVGPDGARAAAEVDLVELPGAQGGGLDRPLVVALSWRILWEPSECAAPEASLGANATQGPPLDVHAPGGFSTCLAPEAGLLAYERYLPARDLHAPRVSLPARNAELPRGPALALDVEPSREDAVATHGAARAEAVAAEGRAAIEAAMELATPAATARASGQAAWGAKVAPSALPERVAAREEGAAEGDPALDVVDAPGSPGGSSPNSGAPRLRESPSGAPPSAWRAPPQPPRVEPAIAEPFDRAGAGFVLATAALLVAAAFALYQRIGRPEALRHPARRALYDAMLAREGPATPTELGAGLALARKSAEYHLRYLVRCGLATVVVSPDEPRRYAIFVKREGAPAAPLDERLVAAVRNAPGRTTEELVAEAGETRSRIDRRMKALVVAGRVRVARRKGVRAYFPAESAS